ncbi:uncharacterized protein LOC132012482 [Mustela nigripes]|uniref:uncharacterized protein LOC132012482 n=1 Tax=Mustela nigripes TaxID=77151 RepID=UPI0028151E4A|nr:uncharacterized protein LOC132012482 [Mustela nigripes]XP_059248510.1 uncharacterized protein LOC132012482 [Mustela nigripes]XP_059248511.1 uncharacterized protein LOC132012482 [Mustela nigripes]
MDIRGARVRTKPRADPVSSSAYSSFCTPGAVSLILDSASLLRRDEAFSSSRWALPQEDPAESPSAAPGWTVPALDLEGGKLLRRRSAVAHSLNVRKGVLQPTGFGRWLGASLQRVRGGRTHSGWRVGPLSPTESLGCPTTDLPLVLGPPLAKPGVHAAELWFRSTVSRSCPGLRQQTVALGPGSPREATSARDSCLTECPGQSGPGQCPQSGWTAIP